MAYVLLPNSGQSLGVTRAQIRENFNLIQQTFDRNHYDFDAVNQGKHSVIQMPEQTVFPLTPVNEGQLLAREYNAKTELAWRPENTGAAADQYILSGMPIRAAARFDGSGANGVKVPVGLSFNILSITKSGAGNTRIYTVLFSTQFPIGAASSNYLVIPYAGSISASTGDQSAVTVNNLAVTGFDLVTFVSSDFISFLVLGG